MKIRRDPLDILASEYVRKRAMYRCGGCERCGHGKTSYKELQTAHFHSRSKRSVRYDPDNMVGLCFACHRYLDGNPIQKIEFFKQILGEEKFNGLNYKAFKPQKPDKEAIRIYLQRKIEELPSRYVTVPNKRSRPLPPTTQNQA